MQGGTAEQTQRCPPHNSRKIREVRVVKNAALYDPADSPITPPADFAATTVFKSGGGGGVNGANAANNAVSSLPHPVREAP